MTAYKRLIISSIREEANNVKSFFFEGEEAQAMPYKAGQYLTFVLPDGAAEIRRSYSIASSPVVQEPLSIAVKRIENGVFSRYLIDRARVGDALDTLGAAGFFTLPEDLAPYRQIFFFAAGSGIVPIFSLLKTVLKGHPQLQVVLIYSNRSPAHAVFLEPLQELAEAFPETFRLELLYSISKALHRARLYKDLVRDFVKQHALAPPAQLLSYLCGPEDYMRKCVYGLRQEGIPAENIRREHFSTLQVGPKLEPPDVEAHDVRLNFRGKRYQFRTQYPDTLLEAAKKRGILLPYSCQVGRCGNCVARCRSGKVWMSYNEVLTGRDLDKGLVLTCVGYPVGGDVELEIGG